MFSRRVLLLSLLCCFVASEQSHCVLRDNCGKFPPGHTPRKKVCVYEGQSEEMKEKLKKTMRKVCPHFEAEVSSKICCSRRQILDLKTSMEALENFVGHCPSCLYNLKKVFCDFTCHPEQSTFLYVSETETMTNLDNEDVKVIKALDYYVDIAFVNTSFNACKNVLFPSQSTSILPYICGPNPCTPKRLLEFMGTPSPQTSPFKINFIHSDEPETATQNLNHYNPSTIPCNVAPPNESLPCSCTNCELSCPIMNFSSYESQGLFMEVGGVDVLSIAMGTVFVVFTVVFLSLVILKGRNQG